jgi:hypothetical protein
LDENKRGSGQSGSVGQRQGRQHTSKGLEVEAGFEVWLAFVRQHLGSSYAWDRSYASDLEQVDAIDAETALLLKIAPEWSAEEFYSACVTADPDFTKGSEHYVTRYFEGVSPRVVKATIPASTDAMSIRRVFISTPGGCFSGSFRLWISGFMGSSFNRHQARRTPSRASSQACNTSRVDIRGLRRSGSTWNRGVGANIPTKARLKITFTKSRGRSFAMRILATRSNRRGLPS